VRLAQPGLVQTARIRETEVCVHSTGTRRHLWWKEKGKRKRKKENGNLVRFWVFKNVHIIQLIYTCITQRKKEIVIWSFLVFVHVHLHQLACRTRGKRGTTFINAVLHGEYTYTDVYIYKLHNHCLHIHKLCGKVGVGNTIFIFMSPLLLHFCLQYCKLKGSRVVCRQCDGL
jgi:hypothetical protein